MITLLADSNALRHPGLEQFLRASRSHCIALSDWTLTEMRKRDALGTSRDSLRVVFLHPEQCFALKRTDLLLDHRIREADDTAALIDYEETIALCHLARSLWQVPQPGSLAAIMQRLEDDAAEMVARLHAEVEDWEEQMVEAVSSFDRTEGSLLRGRGDATIPHTTMEKVFDLLLQTTRDFMIRNQQKGGSEPMKVIHAMGMFGFRYSLCVLLYTLGWVRTGSQRDRSVEKRVNDVIDLQVATVGTFFNGVLSGDKKLQEVSRAARHLLRLWGAYVGEDWIPTGLSDGQSLPA
jgi:hypothetical protein